MKIPQVLLYIPIAILAACSDTASSNHVTEENQAQEIVDKSILAMGGGMLDHASVTFKFRTRTYAFWQKDGKFKYTRTHVDTLGTSTVDVLTNDGLMRSIDNEEVDLDSTWTQRYSNSVNSVLYFAFLPYRLNDPAVMKTYNGLREINGKSYHEVEVQFRKEGGGVDHDDNFLYWFDENNFTLDYFAYDYITGDKGVRFRQAINRRKVNGLTVQDYINYKPINKSTDLHGIFEAYKRGELKELSRIELENVRVNKLASE